MSEEVSVIRAQDMDCESPDTSTSIETLNFEVSEKDPKEGALIHDVEMGCEDMSLGLKTLNSEDVQKEPEEGALMNDVEMGCSDQEQSAGIHILKTEDPVVPESFSDSNGGWGVQIEKVEYSSSENLNFDDELVELAEKKIDGIEMENCSDSEGGWSVQTENVQSSDHSSENQGFANEQAEGVESEKSLGSEKGTVIDNQGSRGIQILRAGSPLKSGDPGSSEHGSENSKMKRTSSKNVNTETENLEIIPVSSVSLDWDKSFVMECTDGPPEISRENPPRLEIVRSSTDGDVDIDNCENLDSLTLQEELDSAIEKVYSKTDIPLNVESCSNDDQIMRDQVLSRAESSGRKGMVECVVISDDESSPPAVSRSFSQVDVVASGCTVYPQPKVESGSTVYPQPNVESGSTVYPQPKVASGCTVYPPTQVTSGCTVYPQPKGNDTPDVPKYRLPVKKNSQFFKEHLQNLEYRSLLARESLQQKSLFYKGYLQNPPPSLFAQRSLQQKTQPSMSGRAVHANTLTPPNKALLERMRKSYFGPYVKYDVYRREKSCGCFFVHCTRNVWALDSKPCCPVDKSQVICVRKSVSVTDKLFQIPVVNLGKRCKPRTYRLSRKQKPSGKHIEVYQYDGSKCSDSASEIEVPFRKRDCKDCCTSRSKLRVLLTEPNKRKFAQESFVPQKRQRVELFDPNLAKIKELVSNIHASVAADVPPTTSVVHEKKYGVLLHGAPGQNQPVSLIPLDIDPAKPLDIQLKHVSESLGANCDQLGTSKSSIVYIQPGSSANQLGAVVPISASPTTQHVDYFGTPFPLPSHTTSVTATAGLDSTENSISHMNPRSMQYEAQLTQGSATESIAPESAEVETCSSSPSPCPTPSSPADVPAACMTQVTDDVIKSRIRSSSEKFPGYIEKTKTSALYPAEFYPKTPGQASAADTLIGWKRTLTGPKTVRVKQTVQVPVGHPRSPGGHSQTPVEHSWPRKESSSSSSEDEDSMWTPPTPSDDPPQQLPTKNSMYISNFKTRPKLVEISCNVKNALRMRLNSDNVARVLCRKYAPIPYPLLLPYKPRKASKCRNCRLECSAEKRSFPVLDVVRKNRITSVQEISFEDTELDTDSGLPTFIPYNPRVEKEIDAIQVQTKTAETEPLVQSDARASKNETTESVQLPQSSQSQSDEAVPEVPQPAIGQTEPVATEVPPSLVQKKKVPIVIIIDSDSDDEAEGTSLAAEAHQSDNTSAVENATRDHSAVKNEIEPQSPVENETEPQSPVENETESRSPVENERSVCNAEKNEAQVESAVEKETKACSADKNETLAYDADKIDNHQGSCTGKTETLGRSVDENEARAGRVDQNDSQVHSSENEPSSACSSAGETETRAESLNETDNQKLSNRTAACTKSSSGSDDIQADADDCSKGRAGTPETSGRNERNGTQSSEIRAATWESFGSKEQSGTKSNVEDSSQRAAGLENTEQSSPDAESFSLDSDEKKSVEVSSTEPTVALSDSKELLADPDSSPGAELVDAYKKSLDSEGTSSVEVGSTGQTEELSELVKDSVEEEADSPDSKLVLVDEFYLSDESGEGEMSKIQVLTNEPSESVEVLKNEPSESDEHVEEDPIDIEDIRDMREKLTKRMKQILELVRSKEKKEPLKCTCVLNPAEDFVMAVPADAEPTMEDVRAAPSMVSAVAAEKKCTFCMNKLRKQFRKTAPVLPAATPTGKNSLWASAAWQKNFRSVPVDVLPPVDTSTLTTVGASMPTPVGVSVPTPVGLSMPTPVGLSMSTPVGASVPSAMTVSSLSAPPSMIMPSNVLTGLVQAPSYQPQMGGLVFMTSNPTQYHNSLVSPNQNLAQVGGYIPVPLVAVQTAQGQNPTPRPIVALMPTSNNPAPPVKEKSGPAILGKNRRWPSPKGALIGEPAIERTPPSESVNEQSSEGPKIVNVMSVTSWNPSEQPAHVENPAKPPGPKTFKKFTFVDLVSDSDSESEMEKLGTQGPSEGCRPKLPSENSRPKSPTLPSRLRSILSQPQETVNCDPKTGPSASPLPESLENNCILCTACGAVEEYSEAPLDCDNFLCIKCLSKEDIKIKRCTSCSERVKVDINEQGDEVICTKCSELIKLGVPPSDRNVVEKLCSCGEMFKEKKGQPGDQVFRCKKCSKTEEKHSERKTSEMNTMITEAWSVADCTINFKPVPDKPTVYMDNAECMDDEQFSDQVIKSEPQETAEDRGSPDEYFNTEIKSEPEDFVWQN